MKILQKVKKIPGGIMIIPFFLGVIINTFIPEVWNYFDKTFSSYLWKTGAMPILSVFLFCNAATINFNQAGLTVKKGIILTSIKVSVGMSIGIFINYITGGDGIFGISPLAIIAAVANSNGGLYAALAGEYGDATDVGAVSFLSINDGPFFTLLALGAAGYKVPLATVTGCIIPIVAGFILGNLDSDIRDFCKPGATLLIPFFAFPLGAGLTLKSILKAGEGGIILGIVSTLTTGFLGYFAYKAMKMKNPEVAFAIGTTAANAASTPSIVASAGIVSLQISQEATAQISAAIITTAILCPLFVNLLHKKEAKKNPQLQQ